jgi:hypothetical protein
MGDRKKRGEAGASNAAGIPFRCHGAPRGYTTSTAIGHPTSPYGAGSLLVRAMRLGVQLPHFNPSERLVRMTDEAMGRCTHPDLT